MIKQDEKGKKESDRRYYRGWVDINEKITKTYLHRYVWEKYNGSIPKGFHIHHIDGNFSNNDISNLECKERSTHLSDHQIHKSERLKEIAIKTLLENSYKASEWHKSEEGRKWHREHAQKALFGEERTIICEGCGKEFTTRCKIKVKYCSRRCKNRINARILYQRKKETLCKEIK